MVCSLPGSSEPGILHVILQARMLEWVAMPSSKGSSQPRDQTHISMSSVLIDGFFTTSATWEAQTSDNVIENTFNHFWAFPKKSKTILPPQIMSLGYTVR